MLFFSFETLISCSGIRNPDFAETDKAANEEMEALICEYLAKHLGFPGSYAKRLPGLLHREGGRNLPQASFNSFLGFFEKILPLSSRGIGILCTDSMTSPIARSHFSAPPG